MNIFQLYIIIIFSSLLGTGYSQNSVLKYEEYMKIVKEHHPVSFAAQLKNKQGAAYIQTSKGAFDPKLNGDISQKYFDGKQYYSYLNAGLKIPTWFGITANAGYNINEGQRLNPESYTASTGLWSAGVEANLGKGLFIDQRRADLKQAEYMNSTSLQEEKLILNQLVLDASIAYFEWYKSDRKLEIYKDAVINATLTLENTKQNAILGDKAFIDTLKASIQLQERQLKLLASKQELYGKKQMLNTFLWQDGFVPLEVDSLLTPALPLIQSEKAPSNIEQLVENHPEILIAQNKLSINQIDYRLKKESLKPTVKLKYNALSSDLGSGVIGDYNLENYTWGASISYPIFTRKERGQLKLYEIKSQEQTVKIANKTASVKYKILTSYNQLITVNDQLIIQEKATQNYQLLYEAEKILFNIGESSLFLVNTREQNWINAKIKMVNLISMGQYSNSIYNYHLMNF